MITVILPQLALLQQVPFIGWLGKVEPVAALLRAASVPTARLLFRRTGAQFFLADGDEGAWALGLQCSCI